LQTFWRVQLPTARRGLAAGVVLGFMRCLGDFGATAILAYHPYTLPTLIFVNVSGEGIPTAIPPAVLVAAVGFLAGGVILFLDTRRRHCSDSGELAAPTALPDLNWIRPDPAAGSGLDIDLHVQVGSFTVHPAIRTTAKTIGILGPSGSGKSLTMRAVAGLLPAVGTVRIGAVTLTDTVAGLTVPVQHRQLGYVAQEDALFEHLDVAGNITFGIRHLPAAERDRRLRELLAAVGLTHLRHAHPPGSPAVSANASPWPVHWPLAPARCCLTSLSPTSTPLSAAGSEASFGTCMNALPFPSSSSPTTATTSLISPTTWW
jgi:hypothetical protein